jgi:hypothetical protein
VVAQAAGGVNAGDELDAVVRAGRLGVLEALLESLGSDEARRERLARVDADGSTLLWQARKRSIAQALLDAGAILVPPRSSARAVDHDDAFPAYDVDEDDDDETDDDGSDDGARIESVTDDFFAGWDLLDALTPGGGDSEDDEDGGSGETDVLAGWAALVDGDSDDTESVRPELDTDALTAAFDALRRLPVAEQRRRVNLADEAGVTLLMRVAQLPESYGQPSDAFGHLVDLSSSGVDLYAVDDCRRDAFDYASYEHDESDLGDTVFVEHLLCSPGSKRLRRLRVNHRDRHGRTLLMRARSPQVAESLVAAGASAWGVDRDGRDALWHALGQQDGWGVYAVVPVVVKAMKATARRRLRVNAADDDGLTPLMRAKNDEAVEALITAGADPLIEDNDGNDAFWHASKVRWSDDRRMMAIEMLKAVGSRQQRLLIREEYKLGAYWNDGNRDR